MSASVCVHSYLCGHASPKLLLAPTHTHTHTHTQRHTLTSLAAGHDISGPFWPGGVAEEGGDDRVFNSSF